MAKRRKMLAVVSAAACAAGALALNWTWVGRGADPCWTTCENWDPGQADPTPCWPSTTRDDVIVPAPSPNDPWAITLITEQIDDMTIYGPVYFGSCEAGTPVLEVDSLTLSAPSGYELEVTIADAKLWTGQ